MYDEQRHKHGLLWILKIEKLILLAKEAVMDNNNHTAYSNLDKARETIRQVLEVDKDFRCTDIDYSTEKALDHLR